MKNLSKKNIIIVSTIFIAAILASLPFIIYLKILPEAVSNERVINFVEQKLEEDAGIKLEIKNPVLKTEMSPVVAFKVEKLSLSKNNASILEIENLDTVLSFSKLFEQRVILKKIGLDYLFADVNKLMALSGQPPTETPKTEWALKWFDSLFYIKKCLIIYQATPDTFVKVSGKDMRITESRDPKFVDFNLVIDVKKGKENIKLSLENKNNVYIKDRKLFIENGLLSVNKSKVFINSVSDEKNNFNLTVFSKKFDVKNVVELLDSNLLVPNGSEILAFFKDINGDFDFNINLNNKGMSGNVLLNRLSLNIVPLNNLPLSVQQGKVTITDNEILLSDFNGYYAKRKVNKIDFSGSVKDYMKSCDTNIVATGIATNDFTKNYLSKVIGYPLELIGDAKTKLVIKSLYNKTDIVWMFKLAKGQDILIDGASLSPTNWDRALKADLQLENNILNIKSINYYIASEINKNSKIKPILTIDGKMDIVKGSIQNLGFNIPKPLPSEFLNVLIGQKFFKKGTIAGNLKVINTGKYPTLEGTLSMEKVRIPSQRLSIKEGTLTTDKNNVHLNAFGRYKKANYKFSGNILNELKLPIIVKNINLTVDNIDVEKLLTSFNNQNTEAAKGLNTIPVAALDDDEEDESFTFDTGILIVEECILNVVKGVYKEINFGNIYANLTLDKDGILQVKSNKFDIAEGHSSLKVHCDLKKHKYDIKLGVKDINSDIMATTLLALKREITGKASGIIALNTDDSMRLNGTMKFIVKDGTISKIGLVEYALKFASLFRNPMAMISPSTIVDLVNVPEGKFNKIVGDLTIKDNVIEKIMIKSSSPQLSSFIIGRFDLENRDATLRIYTKFSSKNKGFAGFMRNISLNSLANRASISSRNDSNFYSVELEQLPALEEGEKDSQVFLTKVDGDVEHFNFLSSLKKIK